VPQKSRFDIAEVRSRFPSLSRLVNDAQAVYFDGPAGSQVPREVADAMHHYILHSNANEEGYFATSVESDGLLDRARRTAATFLGAPDPDCVIFGANMTTLTFAFSRAMAKTWRPGDEIIVSHLDHDGNVAPWVTAAADAGVVVKHIPICAKDCTLDLQAFSSMLSAKTKLVAVGYASNAAGTINPIREMVSMAHDVGALVYVDAVHYSPHGLIDVVALGCDFLVASAYKFFGPHVGILWGRRDLMKSLPAYKVRPASNELPWRWMTGTPNQEGIIGTAAAIDYLASLSGGAGDLRSRLKDAFKLIGIHERDLCIRLLGGLDERPQFRVWGITDVDRVTDRVPTISITHTQHSPKMMAKHLASRGIFTWSGNHYALSFSESLELEPEGTLRIGLLHYNTHEEVDRLLAVLDEL